MNNEKKEIIMEISNEEWKERLDNLLFEKWSYETAGGDNYDALHPEYDSKNDPWFSQKHNDGLKQSYKQAKYDYQELKDSIKYVRGQINKGEIKGFDWMNKMTTWYVSIAAPYYKAEFAWTAATIFDSLSADILGKLNGKDVPIEKVKAITQKEAIKKYKLLHPEFKEHFKQMDGEDIELSL